MMKSISKAVAIFGAAGFFAASCVYIDDNLGKNFIPKDQIYDVRTAELSLGKSAVWLEPVDSLSGYSSSRITVGAIRDGLGVSRRASAFTVVPLNDTIDVGQNTVIRQFRFSFLKDTLSCSDDSQRGIMQNIKVYSLSKPLDSTIIFSSDFTDEIVDRSRRISAGVPVYTGGDSLAFDMSKEYAKRFVDLFSENPSVHGDLQEFLDVIPGIYLETDDPAGAGGRINMFGIKLGVEDYYYVTSNYAELKITADYGTRTAVDTSFLFYYGPADRSGTSSAQSAFNICSQPTDVLKHGGSAEGYSTEEETYGNTSRTKIFYKDGTEIRIDGGNGLKPVVSARGIRAMVLDKLAEDGLDPAEVIINKATIVFPFKFPDDYADMPLYPAVLSPTCKLSLKTSPEDGSEPIKYAQFAGLTDASVDSENQGDINRSLCIYSPDISHHVQEVIRLGDDADFAEYDIWMLIMAYETVTTSNNSSSSIYDSSYYQNLLYAQYYNNMYGYGGYGGYGYGGYGYDSYGYGYNNYLNYAMLAMAYGSGGSSSTTSTDLQLDKDRYYAGILYGTETEEGEPKPTLKLIYSTIHKD